MTDEELLKDLDKFVQSKLPDEKVLAAMAAIRKTARADMEAFIKNCPDGAKRTEALASIQTALYQALKSLFMPEMQFDRPVATKEITL